MEKETNTVYGRLKIVVTIPTDTFQSSQSTSNQSTARNMLECTSVYVDAGAFTLFYSNSQMRHSTRQVRDDRRGDDVKPIS